MQNRFDAPRFFSKCLTVTLIVAVVLVNTATWGQIVSDAEYSFMFDVQEGPDVDVNILISIHPGSSTWRTYSIWLDPLRIDNISAKDEATGNQLTANVERRSETATNITVVFPGPRGDGYQFRVLFRVFGKVTKASASELSFSWLWGGRRPFPQTVRILLPEKYDLKSVISDDKNVQYTKSTEKNRVVVEFKGNSPAGGVFRWTATAVVPTPAVTISITSETTSRTQSTTSIVQRPSTESDNTLLIVVGLVAALAVASAYMLRTRKSKK